MGDLRGFFHMLFRLDTICSTFMCLVLLTGLLTMLLTMLSISIEFFEFLDKNLEAIMKTLTLTWST